jgi:glycosyltransferase involved in cell wall biosynthesis
LCDKLAAFLRERQAKSMDRIFGQFSAIIPAFNEARTIERAVLDTKRVLGNEASTIVVDDGSSDKTSEIALRAGARVITHDRNRGKGAAIKTGALASTNEWILVLDADLSTKPDELHGFIDLLDTSDIIFGSRRASGSIIERQQPWYRVKAGQFFNILVRLISGLPYHDTQCGFKAFRMQTCRPIFEALQTEGWSADVELLMRAHRLGLKLSEQPVHWSHVEGSRVRLSHAFRILSELYRLRRVIP